MYIDNSYGLNRQDWLINRVSSVNMQGTYKYYNNIIRKNCFSIFKTLPMVFYQFHCCLEVAYTIFTFCRQEITYYGIFLLPRCQNNFNNKLPRLFNKTNNGCDGCVFNIGPFQETLNSTKYNLEWEK